MRDREGCPRWRAFLETKIWLGTSKVVPHCSQLTISCTGQHSQLDVLNRRGRHWHSASAAFMQQSSLVAASTKLLSNLFQRPPALTTFNILIDPQYPQSLTRTDLNPILACRQAVLSHFLPFRTRKSSLTSLVREHLLPLPPHRSLRPTKVRTYWIRKVSRPSTQSHLIQGKLVRNRRSG